MNRFKERRLLRYDEAASMLCLTVGQVEWLVSTRQLREITICGEKRIDQRDIDRLLTFYGRVQERRNNHARQSLQVQGR